MLKFAFVSQIHKLMGFEGLLRLTRAFSSLSGEIIEFQLLT